MPHIVDILSQRTEPGHTFEFFPPRTEPGLVNLLDRIRRMAASPLRTPLAVSVTWGAGGGTADRSLELAEHVVKMGLEVVLHITCTNMPKDKVDLALKRCKEIGIQNVLALRGDAPRTEEYAINPPTAPDFFQHADDLVRYIRREHGDYFCIGVAGYPTGHPDSENKNDDLHWLKVKCDAGANFIVTQLFYDVGGFEDWVKICREFGISQPIIPGVMPIQNFASFTRLVNLTKCPVPSSIMQDLEPIKSDDAAVKKFGAQLATTMVRRLVSSGLVPAVHFCTLNLEKSVRIILENLGWSSSASGSTEHQLQGSPLARHNQLIQEDDQVSPRPIAPNGDLDLAGGLSTSSNFSISPSQASQLAQWGLTHGAAAPAPKQGVSGNSSNNPGEDSWDEFPNGRFTDVRSPAYGEIDGWGGGLKTTAAKALKEWGTPSNIQDLSELFTRYLQSDPSTPTTPFCDLPLSPESATILTPLIQLNSPSQHRWTVGSQPAVDAAHSDDPIHGWGPPGGYVFQKAFVEFFTKEEDVRRLQEKVGNNHLISMYASNKKGDYFTNTLKDAVNAVTWAAFPGQEIVQSTIIEEISFMAWKEEAFDIWSEWSQLYPRNSASRKLLESIGNDWWLVSLIHHDYKDKDALWRFLLEENN